MKIRLTSILVNDQDAALDYYTWPLEFDVKSDVPAGEYRWLTVVSRLDPDGPELLLEPNAHPAAKVYQEALFKDGIPAATFFVDDLQHAYERLMGKGVIFVTQPTRAGEANYAVFDDTCGNLVQLVEE